MVVEGFYEVGMQDQALLGTESGLAIPDGSGGVDLHISTQWLHVDHEQVVASLGLAPEQVRLHLAGIGGAFGAREDISLQIHLCLLALRTGRPVKMVYDRAESFVGHVHRHPARMWYRHEADRDGNLVRVEARILLDGGAYESTSSAVLANASLLRRRPLPLRLGAGPRRRRPDQQPAGRGDARVRCHPVVLRLRGADGPPRRRPGHRPRRASRLRNALGHGDRMATTNQLITGSLPTGEVIESLAATCRCPTSHRATTRVASPAAPA